MSDLDRHTSMEEYLHAKANIRRYQQPGDVCLYFPNNENAALVANVELHNPSPDIAPAKRFGVADDGEVYIASNTFFVQNDPICSIPNVQIPGQHNLMNACAAISAARATSTIVIRGGE